jgi:hypothetical protein
MLGHSEDKNIPSAISVRPTNYHSQNHDNIVSLIFSINRQNNSKDIIVPQSSMDDIHINI